MQDKYLMLKQTLHEMERVAVAFSGGVDSTLVLKVAHDCLGKHAVALTAISPSMPAYEQAEAEAIARGIGVRFMAVPTRETEDAHYLANTPSRCYFCKSEVYQELIEYAAGLGFPYMVDGTNADDAGDHRPGRQAARERGVRSPLQEVGLKKSEIRKLAKELGLPNWDKPAAACLSSRIPYGTTIRPETLSQIAQAELALRRLGIRQVRVRHHDSVARIEIEPANFEILLQHREKIISEFAALGYHYIALDLAGFRSGSMNEVLAPSDGRGKTPSVID